MAFPLNTSLHAFAAAAALAAGRMSAMFAHALELSVADCADFAALPSNTMTEDVNLFFEDAIAFTCDAVTTAKVDGPYKFRVTSDVQSVTFTKMRFEISGGAEFEFDLANNEFDGTATFTGVTEQDSDGGVFHVESGSTARFEVPVSFESNSVTAGYSGGAVYAGGLVVFEYDAYFTGNEALRDGDDDAAGGGAVAVGADGKLRFRDAAVFTDNVAYSGGQGGAIENGGSTVFNSKSYFWSNNARENGDGGGGLGGAVYTKQDATTVFQRRTIMHLNEASSGGALYNQGTTTLESQGFFKGNEARGNDRADGGHIYTNGPVSVEGRVNFREGMARRYGGAIYIDDEGSLNTDDAVDFRANSAGERCDDIFDQGCS